MRNKTILVRLLGINSKVIRHPHIGSLAHSVGGEAEREWTGGHYRQQSI